jgi:hypothetical protein
MRIGLVDTRPSKRAEQAACGRTGAGADQRRGEPSGCHYGTKAGDCQQAKARKESGAGSKRGAGPRSGGGTGARLVIVAAGARACRGEAVALAGIVRHDADVAVGDACALQLAHRPSGIFVAVENRGYGSVGILTLRVSGFQACSELDH